MAGVIWRDILQFRRQQNNAYERAQQPVLFELKRDCRPLAERTVAGRYREAVTFLLVSTSPPCRRIPLGRCLELPPSCRPDFQGLR